MSLRSRLARLEALLADRVAPPEPISEETWARVNDLLAYSGDNPDTLSRQAQVRAILDRARARKRAFEEGRARA